MTLGVIVVIGLLLCLLLYIWRTRRPNEILPAPSEFAEFSEKDVGRLGTPGGSADRESADQESTDSTRTAGGSTEAVREADRTNRTTEPQGPKEGVTPNPPMATPEKPPTGVEPELPKLVLRDNPVVSAGDSSAAPASGNPFVAATAGQRRIVFVIDRSVSMAGERLDRVKIALGEAIDRLDPEQHFAIIVFSDQPESWQDALCPATPPARKQARAWLAQIASIGGTNVLPALELALSLRPDKIVVLSDGEFHPFDVDQATAANARLSVRCRIDCIGLAESVETLKQLARQNGPGAYYQAH